MAMDVANKRDKNLIYIDEPHVIFELDKQSLKVGDREVRLDHKIAKLLTFFLKNSNRVISRVELIENVWESHQVSNDAINRAISVLRKSLGGKKDQYITTIPKVGYQFNLSNKSSTQTSSSCDYGITSHHDNRDLNDSNHSYSLSGNRFGDHSFCDGIDSNQKWTMSWRLKLNKDLYWPIVGLLIFVVIIVVFNDETHWKSLSHTKSLSTALSPVSSVDILRKQSSIHIVVLPLSVLEAEASTEVIVNGLMEDIQHHLSRVPGVVVTLPSKALSQQTTGLDTAELYEKYNANFAIKGSFFKLKDGYKLTLQLFDLPQSQLVYSNTFIQNYQSIFDNQNVISQELVAALHLSILDRTSLYSDTAKKMDIVSVETLYRARSKIYKYTESEIREAIDDLEKLNRKYPETPEILGLLAFARFQLGTSSTNNLDFIDRSIEESHSVLELDPVNFYALATLANAQIIFPELRSTAFDRVKVLLREYPGKNEVYNVLLFHLSFINASCDQITNYLGLIPESYHRNKQTSKEAIAKLVDLCHQDLDQQTLDELYLNPYFIRYAYALHIPGDVQYHAIRHFATTYPNQRYLSQRLWLQLLLRDSKGIAESIASLEENPHAAWSVDTLINRYIYNYEVNYKPSQLGEFMRAFYHNTPLLSYSAALIKQARQENNQDIIVNYLKDVPQFDVSLSTLHESFALLVLLHEVDKQQAAKLAQNLMREFNRLRNEDRATYRIWKFAPYALITAIYAGEMSLASQILEHDFGENFPYWYFDKAILSTILSDYSKLSVVEMFLLRVEQDIMRMRHENFINS
jgi:DNA-binding winged helix-turn-helix (wHTH) protein/TolB-like protein